MTKTAGKALFFAGFAAVLTALTGLAYLATARFLSDRQAVVNRLSPAAREERRTTEGVTRRSTFPTGFPMAAPVAAGVPAAVNTGEAAVQRQLKAIDEINRVNEMNRQLMDQQRRAQNQR